MDHCSRVEVWIPGVLEQRHSTTTAVATVCLVPNIFCIKSRNLPQSNFSTVLSFAFERKGKRSSLTHALSHPKESWTLGESDVWVSAPLSLSNQIPAIFLGRRCHWSENGRWTRLEPPTWKEFQKNTEKFHSFPLPWKSLLTFFFFSFFFTFLPFWLDLDKLGKTLFVSQFTLESWGDVTRETHLRIHPICNKSLY